MGAYIHYKNKIFEFFLINDRGQFLIDIKSEGKKETLDLAFLLSFLELQKKAVSFNKLGKKEKNSIYSIIYDYSDPFKRFFQEIDSIQDVLTQLSVKEIEKVKLNEFFSGRGKWLFPDK